MIAISIYHESYSDKHGKNVMGIFKMFSLGNES